MNTGGVGSMIRRVALIAMIALVAWIPGESQSKTRPLTGLVSDKRGNALPGSVVQLENTFDLSVRSFITGPDGRYHFNALNSDVDFTLKANYKNHWSDTKTLSKFDSSPHPELNLVIPIE
jgi:hypothetical protein